MRRLIFIAVVFLGCARGGPVEQPPTSSTSVAAEPAGDDDVQPVKKLERKDPLPAATREAIQQVMTLHGRRMESLQWSTLMLDYETTETLAKWLSEGTQAGEDPALPPEFAALRQQMLQDAGALHAAATARDGNAVADTYGRMASTCIRCHALYLNLPGETSTP